MCCVYLQYWTVRRTERIAGSSTGLTGSGSCCVTFYIPAIFARLAELIGSMAVHTLSTSDLSEVWVKFWQFLDTSTLPFFSKILMGFCSDGPCECSGQTARRPARNWPNPHSARSTGTSCRCKRLYDCKYTCLKRVCIVHLYSYWCW